MRAAGRVRVDTTPRATTIVNDDTDTAVISLASNPGSTNRVSNP